MGWRVREVLSDSSSESVPAGKGDTVRRVTGEDTGQSQLLSNPFAGGGPACRLVCKPHVLMWRLELVH